MTPVHESLINHLMLQHGCCHAPSGRYCANGRELWMQYRAECVVTGGREIMAMVRIQSPEWADEIKNRAIATMGANHEQVGGVNHG